MLLYLVKALSQIQDVAFTFVSIFNIWINIIVVRTLIEVLSSSIITILRSNALDVLRCINKAVLVSWHSKLFEWNSIIAYITVYTSLIFYARSLFELKSWVIGSGCFTLAIVCLPFQSCMLYTNLIFSIQMIAQVHHCVDFT